MTYGYEPDHDHNTSHLITIVQLVLFYCYHIAYNKHGKVKFLCLCVMYTSK
jgi:hypothetical protein